MRKFLIIGSIAVALLLGACTKDDNTNSEYAVKSDVGNITKEEFYEKLVEQDDGFTLQQLILDMVLSNSYTVEESEIDERMKEYEEDYGGSLELILLQQGYPSIDAFREALKMSMLYEKAIYDGVEVTDAEIDAAYERMKEEINARHILVTSLELATRVKDLLEEGEEFKDLVSQYSIDPGTSSTGGELGYFTALDMVPEFEEAAYSMEIDEISDPVETVHGFHVIQVLDRRANEDLAPLEDISDVIYNKLKRAKVTDDVATEKIDQLLIDANLDIQVSGYEDLFKLGEIDPE